MLRLMVLLFVMLNLLSQSWAGSLPTIYTKEEIDSMFTVEICREKEFASFESIFENAPSLSDGYEHLYRWAKSCDLSGEKAKSVKLLHKLSKSSQDNEYYIEASYRLADHYYKQGEFREAEAFYKRVLESDGLRKDYEVYSKYMLGFTYFKLENISASLDNFFQVVESPKHLFEEVENLPGIIEDSLRVLELIYKNICEQNEYIWEQIISAQDQGEYKNPDLNKLISSVNSQCKDSISEVSKLN